MKQLQHRLHFRAVLVRGFDQIRSQPDLEADFFSFYAPKDHIGISNIDG